MLDRSDPVWMRRTQIFPDIVGCRQAVLCTLDIIHSKPSTSKRVLQRGEYGITCEQIAEFSSFLQRLNCRVFFSNRKLRLRYSDVSAREIRLLFRGNWTQKLHC